VAFTITDSKVAADDLVDNPDRIAEADPAIVARSRP